MNRACRSLEATSASSAKGRHARVSCVHTKTALGSNGRSAPLKAGSASSGPFFLPPAFPPAEPGAMPVRRSPAPGGLAPGAAPLAGGAAAAPGLAALAAGLTPAPVALLSVWLPPPCQTRVAAVSRRIALLGGAALAQAGAKSALVAELGAQGSGRVRRRAGQLTSFFLTDCSMQLWSCRLTSSHLSRCRAQAAESSLPFSSGVELV